MIVLTYNFHLFSQLSASLLLLHFQPHYKWFPNQKLWVKTRSKHNVNRTTNGFQTKNCELKQEQSNSFYILNYSLSLFSLCKNKICVLSFFIFYMFCCSSQSLSLSSAACSKSRLAAALFISLVSSSMIFSLLSSSRYSINSLAEGFSNVACLAILS